MKNRIKYLIILFVICCGHLANATGIWVEAESFSNKGGWSVDQQFVFEMGSPYLIAHGMGKRVADASTEVDFSKAGHYHVYVRCYNWTSPWSDKDGAGRFALMVGNECIPGQGTSKTKRNKTLQVIRPPYDNH